MSRKFDAAIESEQKFFHTLWGALAGIGLIGFSVYLGAKDDFLALLLINGGNFLQYGLGLAIALLFLGGIILIARHVINEDLAGSYYEHISN